LREAVRDNVALAWDHSEHPDYVEFKKLAPKVAAIIARSRPMSRDLLMQVTSNIHEIPNKRVRNVSEKPALEQMRQNLKDLECCAKEWSRQPQSND
jgi:hypothetical protein